MLYCYNNRTALFKSHSLLVKTSLPISYKPRRKQLKSDLASSQPLQATSNPVLVGNFRLGGDYQTMSYKYLLAESPRQHAMACLQASVSCAQPSAFWSGAFHVHGW